MRRARVSASRERSTRSAILGGVALAVFHSRVAVLGQIEGNAVAVRLADRASCLTVGILAADLAHWRSSIGRATPGATTDTAMDRRERDPLLPRTPPYAARHARPRLDRCERAAGGRRVSRFRCDGHGSTTAPLASWLSPAPLRPLLPARTGRGSSAPCANQLHQWAHATTPGARRHFALQRRGLDPLAGSPRPPPLPAAHLSDYCISGGWLNRPLDALGFWRALERAVSSRS